MSSEIANLSIERLAHAYRTGQLKPTEVTRAMLTRIEHVDDRLGSYVHVATDFALQSAERAETEMAWALTAAMKDIFNDVEPTTAGMVQTPKSWRTGTATVFERARRAGAVILGAVATTEGVFSDYHPSNQAPRNPWDRTLWPGASSSGPAVVTAAGLCFGAFGSDTGGLIRFPAAATGVTGLSPTWGRVSRFGVAPLSERFGTAVTSLRCVRAVATSS